MCRFYQKGKSLIQLPLPSQGITLQLQIQMQTVKESTIPAYVTPPQVMTQVKLKALPNYNSYLQQMIQLLH